MLESIVSSLLSKYLGDYVEGLDKDNLNLTLSSGGVDLTNLRLKKSALDGLELPVVIKEGYLGKLSLSIPWSSLSSKPAIVRIDRVYLLAGPKHRAPESADEVAKRELTTKQRALQLAEALGMDKAAEAEDTKNPKKAEEKKEDGFFARLGMKVVDNLQVFVNNIHIRYEDDKSNPKKPFVVGITLDSLHAQSTDDQWKPTFLTVGSKLMHKLAQLKNLSVYCNTLANNTFLKYSTIEEMVAAMDKQIQTDGGEAPDHAYILQPISGALKALVDANDAVDLSRPKISLDLQLDQLGVALNQGQFRRVLDILEYFSLYTRGLPYMRLRPPLGESPTTHPKSWWKFAIRAVSSQIRAKYDPWSWENIKRRKVDRETYIETFKKRQRVSEAKLSKAEKDTIQALETKLDYQDVILYRKLANSTVGREKAREEKQKSTQGWFGGWFSKSAPATAQDEVKIQAEETQAMQEIYAAIGFDESQQAKPTVYPKEYVKMRMDFRMKQAIVSLTREDDKRQPILALNTQQFIVSLLMREGSMSVEGGLNSIFIAEFHTLKGKELHFVKEDVDDRKIHDKKEELQLVAAQQHNKFLDFKFDMNPIDAGETPIDIRLNLKVQPLLVIFSRNLIERVVTVFASDEDSAVSNRLSEISTAAKSSLTSIQQRAQDGIKYALGKRKNIVLDLDLYAPRVIVPQAFDENGIKPGVSCVVVDLGRVGFKSDPAAQRKAVTVQSEGKTVSASVTEDYFYDTYTIKVIGLQAVAVGEAGEWATVASDPDAKSHIVRKFDIVVDLKLCNVDTADIPNVKLFGQLPAIDLEVSQEKVVRVMSVVRAVLASSAPAKPAEVAVPVPAGSPVSLAPPIPRSSARGISLLGSMPETPSIQSTFSTRRQEKEKHTTAASRWQQAFSNAVAWTKPDTEAEGHTPVSPLHGGTAPAEHKSLVIEFQFGRLSFSLKDKTPDRGEFELVRFLLSNVNAKVEQTNWKVGVAVSMQQLHILDSITQLRNKEQAYMVSSGSDSQALINVNYTLTPKESPIYKKVDNTINATLGSIDVFVNRPTVAALLQVVTQVVRSLAESQPEPSPPVFDPSADLAVEVFTTAPRSQSQSGLDQDSFVTAPRYQSPSRDDEFTTAPRYQSPEGGAAAAKMQESVKAAPIVDLDSFLAKVDLKVTSIGMHLNKDGATFFKVKVSNTEAAVNVASDGTLSIPGSIGGLEVTEDGGDAWNALISIDKDDRVVKFCYQTFNKDRKEYPGYDMAIQCSIGAFRTVYTHRIIKELATYFGAFSKMRELMGAAASYYYKASLEAVQKTTATSKVKLDITINNPHFVVPPHSKSNEFLILDLGKITVSNAFIEEGGIWHDKINVGITDLNLKTSFKQVETPFINRTTLQVKVDRVISDNPTHVVPDVKVELSVPDITLKLSEVQIDSALLVTSNNLGEPVVREDVREIEMVTHALTSVDFNAKSWLEQPAAPTASQAKPEEPKEEEDKPWVGVSVGVAIGQVSLEIFYGTGFAADGSPSSLASFAMRNMAVSLVIRSDSSMALNFTLADIALQDTRPNSVHAYKTLLSPWQNAGAMVVSNDNADLLTVVYDAEPKTQYTHIQIKLRRPRLFIVPETLAAIYKYVMKQLAGVTKSLTDLNKPAPPVEAAPDVAPASAVIVASASAAEEKPETTMRLDVEIVSPEICVVENTTATSSPSLVLHLGISQIRIITTSGGQQKIDLHLQGFDVAKCIIRAQEARSLSDVTLLVRPFTIGFTLSVNESRTRKIAVDLGVLQTLVSYRDLRMFIKIYKNTQPLLQAFTNPETAEAAPAAKIEAEAQGSPALEDSSASRGPESGAASPPNEPEKVETEEEIAARRGPLTQQIVLTLKGLDVNLLDDKRDSYRSTPVSKLLLDNLQMDMRTWEKEMELYAGMETIELYAYNDSLAAHEPVIEPWGIGVLFKQDPVAREIQIEAEEMLDLNVTKSLLEVIFNTTQLTQELSADLADTGDAIVDSAKRAASAAAGIESPMSGVRSEKRLSWNPYVIRNLTHYTIQYWPSPAASDSDGSSSAAALANSFEIPGNARVLDPGAEEPLELQMNRKDIDSTEEESAQGKYMIDLLPQGLARFMPVKNLPVSKVGVHSREILPGKPFVKIVADIKYKNGSKVITLRSDHILENNSNHGVEVTVLHNDHAVKTYIVAPRKAASLESEESSFTSLRIRPTSPGYRATDIHRKKLTKEHMSGVVCCLYDEDEMAAISKKESPEHKAWLCAYQVHIDTTLDGTEDFRITLKEPFRIENLLPTDIGFKIVNSETNKLAYGVKSLKQGDHVSHYDLDSLSHLKKLTLAIKVPEFEWSKPIELLTGNFEDPLKVVVATTQGHQPLRLFVDVKRDNGTFNVSIFANYWIINQTGLRLLYKRKPDSKLAAGQVLDEKSATELEEDANEWYKRDISASVDYKYAKNRFLYGDRTLSLKVEDSIWSKEFPLGVQNQGMITIEDSKSKRGYEFAVVVAPAPGKFWRTKLVRLYPGAIFLNKTARPLTFHQVGTPKPRGLTTVEQNQQLPFHWPSVEKPKQVAIGMPAAGGAAGSFVWSTNIRFDAVDNFQLKLRPETVDASVNQKHDDTANQASIELLQVAIKLVNGTTFVVVSDSNDSDPDYIPAAASYRINNKSSATLIVHQKRSDYTQRVEPKSSIKYSWDEPQMAEPKLLIRLAPTFEDKPNDGDAYELSLDTITDDFPLMRIGKTKLMFEVQADGPVRVLNIDVSRDRTLTDASAASSELAAKAQRRVVSLKVNASLRGIGLSIIDHHPQELMYISLQTIVAKLEVSNIDQNVELLIGTGQIDNQLYMTPFPILMYKVPSENPFLHFTMVKDTRYDTINFFRYFALQIQTLDICVDQPFLIRLLSWSDSASNYLISRDVAGKEKKLLEGTDELPELSDEDIKVSDMFYFEFFHLNPIKVNVTFLAIQTIDGDADETVIEKVLGYVGALASIERAPLELNALILEHPFASRTDLVSRITTHYTRAGLSQAYKIIGSADFLGNPVSLVSNLGTGFKDFFYEPASAIVKSPKDFGRGLAKGTSSLIKKSTYALFDTASKLTGTVAKVGATLTMDDDYKKERAQRAARQAKHAGEGVLFGLRDFGIGLYKGVTGVVVEPIKGAQREGALGLFKGVGKGLAGVVLKPTIGAVDLVSRTTEGIKNTAVYFDEKLKAPVRPPRYFPPDQLVTVFDFDKSVGQQIIKTLQEERYRRERYLAHTFIGEGDCIALTTRRVFSLSKSVLKLGGNAWSVDWTEKVKDLTDAEITPKGVELYINPPKGSGKARLVKCTPAEAAVLHKQVMALGIGAELIREKKVFAKHKKHPKHDEEHKAKKTEAKKAEKAGESKPAASAAVPPRSNDYEEEDTAIKARKEKTDKLRKQKLSPQAQKEQKKKEEKTPLLDKKKDDSEEEGACSCCCSM